MESEKNTLFFKMRTTDIAQPVLAMAFVNMQPLDYVYDEEKAFQNGSLFPNITKPFYYGGNYK